MREDKIKFPKYFSTFLRVIPRVFQISSKFKSPEI